MYVHPLVLVVAFIVGVIGLLAAAIILMTKSQRVTIADAFDSLLLGGELKIERNPWMKATAEDIGGGSAVFLENDLMSILYVPEDHDLHKKPCRMDVMVSGTTGVIVLKAEGSMLLWCSVRGQEIRKLRPSDTTLARLLVERVRMAYDCQLAVIGAQE